MNGQRAGQAAPVLRRISAAGDGSVWGLDPAGTLLGNTYDVVPWEARPGPRLVSVGAGTDSTVYAVGERGDLYAYRDGWTDLGPADGYQLASVSVGGASSVWGTDAHGQLLTYQPDAAKWTPADPPSGGGVTQVCSTLDGSVFCLSRPGSVHLRQGASWVPLSGGRKFTAIGAGEGGWLWGVTADGLFQYAGGESWQPVAGPGVPVARIACGADLTVWVTDTAGGLHQFDAIRQTWRPVRAPGPLAAIALGDITTAWAVTASGEACQYTRDASQWNPAGAPGAYAQLAAVNSGALWAVTADAGTATLTRSGTGWTVTAQPPGPAWVAAGHDGSVWGARADGAVIAFDQAAKAWEPLPPPPGAAVRVSAGDAASVTALDASGAVHQYDAGPRTWQTLSAGAPTGGFFDISALPGGAVYAVTAAGDIYLFLGTWVASADSRFVAVSAASAEEVWAIDTDGHPVQLMRSGVEGGAAVAPGLPGWDAEDVFNDLRSTHLWIVNRAIERAAAEGGPVGAWLKQVLRPGEGRLNDPLHDNMCQGLYDADFVAPYNDPRAGINTYCSHFYNPDTGQNFLFETSPTALTQGSAFFTRSVDAYLRGELDGPDGAGYQLGLALHYMTDVTQPMHAGNFTWLSSRRWGYHTDYEGYVMTLQNSEGFVPASYALPRLDGQPGSYIEAAARHSQPYLEDLTPIWRIFRYTGFDSYWAGLARASAAQLLGYAIAATAAFLLAWGDRTYRLPKDWQDAGHPAPTVTATAGIGTAVDGGRPYLFVRGSDAHLWCRWYTGSEWAWADHEWWRGSEIRSGIGADTSAYGVAAFMLDSASQVLARWFNRDDYKWYWTNLGIPPGPGAPHVASAAVAAVPVGDTAVFILTDQGVLFKNQVPHNQWEQISPPSGRRVTVIAGAAVLKSQRCVMVTTDDRQLWLWLERYGSEGAWVPAGAPQGTTVARSLGLAPYVGFIAGDDGRVWQYTWDQSGVTDWRLFGTLPDDQTIAVGRTANPASFPYYKPWLIAVTEEGPLVLATFDESGVIWDDRGAPGKTSIVSVAGFVPYQGDFLKAVVGADGHLWV